MVEVEKLQEEYDLEVHFAPFLLRPDIPPEGSAARHVTPVDAPPTALEMRGEGLGIKFNRGRERTSYSHLALEAAEFAFEHGDWWNFHKAMLRAYFEDLRDVGDIETIVDVGRGTGLPEADLRAALQDRRYQERVDQGIEWSRQIGVTAIPTFVVNERYGIVGAQELPVFRDMLDKLGHKPKSQT